MVLITGQIMAIARPPVSMDDMLEGNQNFLQLLDDHDLARRVAMLAQLVANGVEIDPRLLDELYRECKHVIDGEVDGFVIPFRPGILLRQINPDYFLRAADELVNNNVVDVYDNGLVHIVGMARMVFGIRDRFAVHYYDGRVNGITLSFDIVF